MKITITSIALLLLFAFASKAQSTYSIKGSVADTAARSKMANTTILVLNAKDSILRKFSRVGADGSFAINGLTQGRYILVLSYPEYADYTDMFTFDGTKKEEDFGRIIMNLKSKLLHDIVIRGQVTAIKMKGDTTEFNAKAYVIQPNSNVEDLLKQLPGIQVDKDGKITAQGERVTKVLLDGEEFFGDDPTLITKNIRGDMVDKVQLYDKKSDQATFTGIDDGIRTKTLNIKLKEDKKNGYFGKLDGGIGTDKYYRGQALYNKFKAKEKFSAFASGANTGQSGLSWEDSQKFTDNSFDAGGDVLEYNGRGFPTSKLAGVHYDNKWNADKKIVNGNYKIGSLIVDAAANTDRQEDLSTYVKKSHQDQTNYNNVFRQKLDMTYTVQLDTTSNLKLYADGAYRRTENNSYASTVTYRGLSNDTLLNTSNNTNMNKSDQHIMNVSAFYTKKLKKKGRTVSVLISGLIDQNNGKNFMKSKTDFYNITTGALDNTQSYDQLKTTDGKHTQFNSNIAYSEPLSKFSALVMNYGLNIDNNGSDVHVFNKSGTVYNAQVDSLTNFYKLTQISNQLGVGVSYSKDKTVLNYGVRASDVAFNRTDEYTGIILKRHFINWGSRVSYIYKFSQVKSFRVNYDGGTIQPNFNQIQPIKNNANPLNITVGNPDLNPAFNNSINLSYNALKVLTLQSFFFSLNYSNTINPIINSVYTDASGKNFTKAINLTNKIPYNLGTSAGISRQIPVFDIIAGINGNIGTNTSYNFTNNLLNTTRNINFGGGLRLNKSVVKKYDIYLSGGPTYTKSSSSLQKNANNNYMGFNASNFLNFYLPAKFQVNSSIDYSYQAKTQAFEDQNQTIWNASLSKLLLKGNNLKLTVSGNDLLNQKQGFSRNAGAGSTTQTNYTTIKRYFMFSITWDFNKMGGGVPSKN